MTADVTVERFEEIVAQVIADLPVVLDNVVVAVEPGEGSTLLGLYTGVPLTVRTGAPMMPDLIEVFRQPILASCGDELAVVALVRKVLLHEVGHHFGLSDTRLSELASAHGVTQ